MRQIAWADVAVPPEEFHVARNSFAGATCLSLHGHDFAEMFLVEEGSGVHEINGTDLPLSAGDLVCVSPGDVHGIRARRGRGLSITNLALSGNRMRELRARYFAENQGFWGGVTVRLSVFQTGELAAELDKLAEEPRTGLALDRFILNLFAELKGGSEPYADCPDWLRDACKDIRKPENFIGGTRAFARLAGRCSEHVGRVLKEATGKTPGEVVTEARLDYATRRLAMSEEPIAGIALDCGYESLSYFYQVFRRRYGIAPRGYRLNSRQVLLD